MRFKPSLEELLDEMSTTIAKYLGVEIGKASLDNSPWHNALNAIKDALAVPSPAQRKPTRERALLQQAQHALKAVTRLPHDEEELLTNIAQAETIGKTITEFLSDGIDNVSDAVALQVTVPETLEQDMPGMWSNSDLSGGETDSRDNVLAGSPVPEALSALAAEWEALARQNAMAAHNAASVGKKQDEYGIDTDSTGLPNRTHTTVAAQDVLAERQRQIETEGWTLSHDDQHRDSELPRAAYTYLLHTVVQNSGRGRSDELTTAPLTWPWAPSWWKPTSPRRNLIKAGALILAEIERLDRTTALRAEHGGRHHGA